MCGVVADGKQLLFASVCVCVWCGHRLGRASVHMGTNDRIWFSEPICKKMKETKLVKTHIGIRAEGLARPHTEISLQRRMVSRRSPVFTRRLLNGNEPLQQCECFHCFTVCDIKELITNQIWDWYQTILGKCRTHRSSQISLNNKLTAGS